MEIIITAVLFLVSIACSFLFWWTKVEETDSSVDLNNMPIVLRGVGMNMAFIVLFFVFSILSQWAVSQVSNVATEIHQLWGENAED